jgi:hypothetical protein
MSEFTRKITVTFEDKESADQVFAELSQQWNDVSQHDRSISVNDTMFVLEDLWNKICDIDVPDKVTNISLEKIDS